LLIHSTYIGQYHNHEAAVKEKPASLAQPVKKKHKAHPSINLSMARTTSQSDNEAMASPKALEKWL
jgi:hypothetical protein